MRLFVGIALTSEVRYELESWLSDLRIPSPQLRWSASEQWHVTLQFLGETEEARYTCVVERLREVRAQEVDIQLAEPGFFISQSGQRLRCLHCTTEHRWP